MAQHILYFALKIYLNCLPVGEFPFHLAELQISSG